jgi:multisubunit Na+/H+ antiporter MnhG subunit
MLNSYELVQIALLMMIIGGAATVLGIAGMYLADDAQNRGSLSKPMAIIGLGFLLVGVFLDHFDYFYYY